MAARAIWKGIIRLGEERVPVKLYSGVEDRVVHFRLLHEPDGVPVVQRLVVPETGETVEYRDARRGYVTPEGDVVVLGREELDALEPAASRDIELLGFVPGGSIDHRWYDRAYFLGPDGSTKQYFALAAALAGSGREGVARWVMRKKEYRGALRLRDGYPVLITLRPAEEVIAASELEAPSGEKLNDKELGMAGQLLSILEAPFDPGEYRDEHRDRVMELIRAKSAGRKVPRARAPRKRPSADLAGALAASIEQERKRA